jgi:hypothetical protein
MYYSHGSSMHAPIVMSPLVSCLLMCCPSVDPLHWAMMPDGSRLGTVRISLSSIIGAWWVGLGEAQSSEKLAEERRW